MQEDTVVQPQKDLGRVVAGDIIELRPPRVAIERDIVDRIVTHRQIVQLDVVRHGRGQVDDAHVIAVDAPFRPADHAEEVGLSGHHGNPHPLVGVDRVLVVAEGPGAGNQVPVGVVDFDIDVAAHWQQLGMEVLEIDLEVHRAGHFGNHAEPVVVGRHETVLGGVRENRQINDVDRLTRTEVRRRVDELVLLVHVRA